MNKIIISDALNGLAGLAAESVSMCVTSPPYFGLRDYGTAIWQSGKPDCDHIISEIRTGLGLSDSPASVRGGGRKARLVNKLQAKGQCPKCGAIRIDRQIGIEETPEEYIDNLTAVFREVHRVLRPDGTLWINIGDSYAGSGKGRNADRTHSCKNDDRQYTNKGATMGSLSKSPTQGGLKPKDLIGIPWLLAFALRTDGWYLRQDIIWHKPNAMPESVTDRCTKSHEYLFLLSKSKKYYFDYLEIQEAAISINPQIRNRDKSRLNNTPGRSRMCGLTRGDYSMRRKRNVWTVPTLPYKEAHFATFPPDLIRPCILAGSRKNDIVLDPFMGSGTTAIVAIEEERRYLGIELNPNYAAIAQRRIAQTYTQHSFFR